MAASNHGHTPAAWTGVTISFIGFLMAAAFTVLAQPVGFVAGVVVVGLGGVVGLVMRSMGMGQQKRLPTRRPQEQSGGRVEQQPESEPASAQPEQREATATNS